ncbi:glycosyltransferase family 2 protein [Lactococcus fujiensis]|uniref:glycosyltransferase family 2 protein n=1 Tax=Lactococcus fujiensis TaxID=610251 RepID=UPI0006D2863B
MINKSPLFSIIVPAFDVEEQIEKCLNSVFTQIFRDFELIVIDDGSTDRTQEKNFIFNESLSWPTKINHTKK